MKNTVYWLARTSKADSPEEFAMELAGHFLGNNPEVVSVSIEVAEKPWRRIHPTTFWLAGNELQIASVKQDRRHTGLRSGFTGLSIMKTADSGFEGFKKDRLTTLSRDGGPSARHECQRGVGLLRDNSTLSRTAPSCARHLVDIFTNHQSKSVQHTLYAMGQAVLVVNPEVTDIRLTMPNIHCLLVDLSRFGLDNPNEIFVPVDEPHGLIEAHIKRSQ